MSKKQFYNVNPIIELAEKEKSPVIIIVGGKGNGKTYGIIEKYLEEYLKTGKILRYLRRYRESITNKAIMSLLLMQKKNIAILSGGKYNSYYYYRNRFYLCREDSEGNKVLKDPNPFIVCSALNSTEGFTGADEGECSAIFFDEFLSRERELKDEFTNLMIFHNNCIRNRTDNFTPLILVGNTMTKNSTLAREFGVDLYKLNKGEKQIIKNKKKETVAVAEYCDTTTKMETAGEKIYSRYDNSKVKMIYTGDWCIGNYPRIQSRYIDSSSRILSIMMKANTPIIVELRRYKKYVFAYVKIFKDDDFNILLTTDITPLKPNIYNYYPDDIKCFRILSELAFNNHIYFESGECGELFKNFLTNLRGASRLSMCYS